MIRKDFSHLADKKGNVGYRWAGTYFAVLFFIVDLVTERRPMLWTIFVILLILWALGFSLNLAGGIIHALLVIAAVLLVVQLLTGRRTVGPPP